MRIKTKKQLIKRDLKKLNDIALNHAALFLFFEQNKELRFTNDGRKKRSKAYKALDKHIPELKKRIFNYSQKAREIYLRFEYVGINPLKAGKYYHAILDQKLKELRDSNLDYRFNGNELNWESIKFNTELIKDNKAA